MRPILLKLSPILVMAFATIALVVAPQRSSARPADIMDESFHADHYPSQRAAIVDLAKQVADELKSRPTTPKQIDLIGGGGVDDGLRQQFISAIERELPDSECTSSADGGLDPTTSPSGAPVARIKLRAGETTPIVAPWSSAKEPKLFSGSFTAFVFAPGGARATLTSKFVEKPWADDWSGFVNRNPSRRWLTGYSETPGTSEAEAMEAARRAAVDDLAKLVRDQMNARAARVSGPRIQVTREWIRDQALSSLRRNVNDMLVRDVFVQRFSRPYGDVWQASILIDASPKVIDKLVDSYNAAANASDSLKTKGWAAVVGIVAVIVLLYFFLNAITKGYFMWRLRALALLLAIAVVLIVFARIGYS
jgi:hypothetical protein